MSPRTAPGLARKSGLSQVRRPWCSTFVDAFTEYGFDVDDRRPVERLEATHPQLQTVDGGDRGHRPVSRLAAEGDLDAVVGCFTDDAEVVDEGQAYRGHDEIRHGRETVTSKFTCTVEVVRSEAVGDDHFVVTAQLEGNFPGSPVQLKFRFVLHDGLIAALEIAP